MRVALVSDIHANAAALTAIEDVLDAADEVLCLGDVVGYYTQVGEVVAAIRRRARVCVRGNHDDFVLNGCPPGLGEAVQFGVRHAASVIDDADRAWLAGLPLTWAGELGGRTWFLVHGSPWQPLDGYLYADSPDLGRLRGLDYDVVAFGQTHRPLLDTTARPILLNPGSVGQSRHRPAVACAAVVDTETLEVEMIERPYDPAPVMALARDAGAGDWITKHL